MFEIIYIEGKRTAIVTDFGELLHTGTGGLTTLDRTGEPETRHLDNYIYEGLLTFEGYDLHVTAVEVKSYFMFDIRSMHPKLDVLRLHLLDWLHETSKAARPDLLEAAAAAKEKGDGDADEASVDS